MEYKLKKEVIGVLKEKIKSKQVAYFKVYYNEEKENYVIEFDDNIEDSTIILASNNVYSEALLKLDNFYYLNLMDAVEQFYMEVDFRTNLFIIREAYRSKISDMDNLSRIRNSLDNVKELVSKYSIKDMKVDKLYTKKGNSEATVTLYQALHLILEELYNEPK